jgi:threonine synthase
MRLYSTNNKAHIVTLKKAVLQSLPPDKGLYMPAEIPPIGNQFIKEIRGLSFEDVSFQVASNLIDNEIKASDLEEIIHNSITFPAPVQELSPNLYSLELWHGPSLAFKDFGARFMAELMRYYKQGDNQTTTILVATSGDTGGAVGAGFLNTPGINVIILFPKGKVSGLQEKQLTTLGNNISALEIEGSFDDCQAIVKKAFIDETLNQKYNLSSANSINIARLIPQSFYYFEAYKQLRPEDKDLIMAVPSGNFGNLTAGLMAKKMGLPIKRFIAATNVNDSVPKYLESGIYKAQKSIATLSNAMDVGNPSNFVRLQHLYGSTWNNIIKDLRGFSANDELTRSYMKTAYKLFKYVCDPHGAIGFGALFNKLQANERGVFLETAHPGKFIDVVEDTLQVSCEIPDRLLKLKKKKGAKTTLSKDFDQFKEYMLS